MSQQTLVTLLVAVVNAALMTAVVVVVERDPRAYLWLAAVILLSVVRAGSWRAYQNAQPGPDKTQRWAIVSVCGALASGLLWGGGAILLFPQSDTYQLFWTFLIGGMCAGAATFHAPHLPTALAYMLPAGLLLAIRLASEGTGRAYAAAAMITVFLAALVVISNLASRRFGDMLRLQFELAHRTTELDAINARLRTEMAQHRATEETLRQAQKMEAMGQLTGGIAHDFNNLLTAVLGSLELLSKRLPTDDRKAARLLDNAVRGAERGAALTQRLLAFGRRQALEPEIVDVQGLVRGMADLLRSSLGAGVRVETRFPMTLATAHVDANQFELALLNLAVNARDAMPGGGNLTIAGREEQVGPEAAGELPPGAYVVLSVTDTGQGMDQETLARATEPFFTTKSVGKGTGLGLSMVHGLAAQSGGRLILQSREGEGTTAELWLPRAEVAAESTDAAAALTPTNAARLRTVLLIDDDPLVLASTAAMLEDLGHAAIEAASAAQALEILRGGAPVELVITAHAVLGMSGVELAGKLHRLRPGLAVLVATGYGELQGPALPGLIRLLKPFGREALARGIERCFERRPA